MAPMITIDADQTIYRFDGLNEISLGRDEDNDVRLPSPYVSRHHGRLVPSDRQWTYRDLGSTRGTWTDGHRITTFTISGDQTFLLGNPSHGTPVMVRTEPPREVFLSYRRADGGYAGWLNERLQARLGPEQIFFDLDHIPLGEDFIRRITSSIRECRVVLVIIGSNWVECARPGTANRLSDPDDPVAMELTAALASNATVMPVFVGGARMPPEEDLPVHLRPVTRQNGVSLSFEHWNEDITKLLAALERLIGRN